MGESTSATTPSDPPGTADHGTTEASMTSNSEPAAPPGPVQTKTKRPEKPFKPEDRSVEGKPTPAYLVLPTGPDDDDLFVPQAEIDEILSRVPEIEDCDKPDLSPEANRERNKQREVDLVKRWMWGAVDPVVRQPLCAPVDQILFTDTRTEPCETTEQCYRLIHKLQRYYMEDNKLPDIPWNFMIGGDGKVYEGRGWTTNGGKIIPPLAIYDCKTLDIAFIGYWNTEEPPIVMTQAAYNLINLGTSKGAIDINAEIQSEILQDYVEPERKIKHWTEWKIAEQS